jgi:hypothetical protein
MNNLRRLVLPALLAGASILGTSSVAMAGLHSRMPMVQTSRQVPSVPGTHSSSSHASHSSAKPALGKNISMTPK